MSLISTFLLNFLAGQRKCNKFTLSVYVQLKNNTSQHNVTVLKTEHVSLTKKWFQKLNPKWISQNPASSQPKIYLETTDKYQFNCQNKTDVRLEKRTRHPNPDKWGILLSFCQVQPFITFINPSFLLPQSVQKLKQDTTAAHFQLR